MFDKQAFLHRPPKFETHTLSDGSSMSFLVMSARQRAELADHVQGTGDPKVVDHMEFAARVIIGSACDEQGTPLFADSDLADLVAIDAELFASMRIGAMRTNKMGGGEDAEAAKN